MNDSIENSGYMHQDAHTMNTSKYSTNKSHGAQNRGSGSNFIGMNKGGQGQYANYNHGMVDVEVIPEITDVRMERGMSNISGQDENEGAI
jgi:hypothetical protein